MKRRSYITHLAGLAIVLVAGVQISTAQIPETPGQNDSLLKKDGSAPDHMIRKTEPLPPPAETPKAGPVEYKNKYTPGQFVKEFIPFIKSPGTWRGKEWAIFAGVAAATYGIMLVDEDIREIALVQKPRYGDRFEYNIIGNEWGGFYFIPALSIALYSHGWLADNHKTKKLGFEIAQAAAYAEIVSFTAKNLIGRYRPSLNRGAFHYVTGTKESFFTSPHNSFPAGHVNAAMALSVVLAKNTKNPFLRILAFAPTALTVTARVLQDDHWASDVFIGGALGYAVGTWVCNFHERKETGLQVSSIYPFTVKYAIK